MDPILSTLNKSAAKTLSKAKLGQNLQVNGSPTGGGLAGGGPAGSRFFDVMTQKSHVQLEELIAKSFDHTSGPGSIRAEDIQLTVDNPDIETTLDSKAVTTDKNALLAMFGEVNGDFNRLNRVVDLLNSGTRLSQQDLIGLQVFSSKAAFATETFVRMGEQLGKTIHGIYNTQV